MKFKNGFAVENGEVDIYVADDNGLYSHKTTEYVCRGTGLSRNSYIDAPPKPKKGFAIIRRKNKWAYIEDHRGEVVYDTVTGSVFEVTSVGKLPKNTTIKPRPSEYHVWESQEWVLTEAAKNRRLKDAKNNKLIQVAQLAEEAAREATSRAEFDKILWLRQVDEASTYEFNNRTKTPTIDMVAAAKGIDREDVIKEVIAERDNYYRASTRIAGRRKEVEQLIVGAKSLAELDQIDVSYKIDNTN